MPMILLLILLVGSVLSAAGQTTGTAQTRIVPQELPVELGRRPATYEDIRAIRRSLDAQQAVITKHLNELDSRLEELHPLEHKSESVTNRLTHLEDVVEQSAEATAARASASQRRSEENSRWMQLLASGLFAMLGNEFWRRWKEKHRERVRDGQIDRQLQSLSDNTNGKMNQLLEATAKLERHRGYQEGMAESRRREERERGRREEQRWDKEDKERHEGKEDEG